MIGCQNKEHAKFCDKNERCGRCELSTCAENFEYHICAYVLKAKQQYRASIKFNKTS
jgi:hypothetical protein